MNKNIVRQREAQTKSLEKKIKKIFRSNLKKTGFGTRSGRIYKVYNDFMFASSIICVGCKDDRYYIYTANSIQVKPLVLDNLFWDIFTPVSDNKTLPISFRATGAFVAPKVKIHRLLELTIESDADDILEENCLEFSEQYDQIINEFSKEVYDISTFYEYIKLNLKYELNSSKLLYILLEIQLKNYSTALELLEIELEADNGGGFSDWKEDKNIFQYAKEYCEERS